MPLHLLEEVALFFVVFLVRITYIPVLFGTDPLTKRTLMSDV